MPAKPAASARAGSGATKRKVKSTAKRQYPPPKNMMIRAPSGAPVDATVEDTESDPDSDDPDDSDDDSGDDRRTPPKKKKAKKGSGGSRPSSSAVCYRWADKEFGLKGCKGCRNSASECNFAHSFKGLSAAKKADLKADRKKFQKKHGK